MSRQVTVLLGAFLAAAALAAPSWQEDAALRDSLSRVHPRMRASWLKERGIRDDYWQGCVLPTDSGLRVVGRWSFGPSYDVDGRVTPTETLVALARGSGVSLIRFARTDSIELELLSDIDAGGLMKRVAVRDTLLYVGSTAGLEIWSISDERNPRQLSWLHTALNDFDVQDSFAYVIGPDDSFKVYNVANAANPVFRGACRDSGYNISVCNGYAYLGDRWGLYVIDARDPANPHRIASWGTDIVSVATRNTICCVTVSDINDNLTFHVLDTRQPASITPLGSLADHGGYDIYLDDSLAFVSGYYTGGHEFQVISIRDSQQPRLIAQAGTPGENNGVWASIAEQWAVVADRTEGLAVFDISNLSVPVLDTALLSAGSSHDVDVRRDLMAVANELSGLKLVGIADPAHPAELGRIDTAGQSPASHAVALTDSFAFIDWDRPPYHLRSIWVGNPLLPGKAGGCSGLQTLAEDMVLRGDTLLYLAGIGRFHVINVARPREPVLVGSCVAGDLTRAGLVVQDTLAYFVGPFDGLEVFSVANPAAPYLVNTVAEIRAAGCDVVDTLLYVGDYDDSLHIWSFANPRAPYQLSSAYATRSGYGVAVMGRYAYVGCDARVRVFDVLDPRNPVEVGWCATPYEIRRVEADSTGVYVCCWEAGVCIFDTFQVGIAEARNDLRSPEQPRVLGSVTGSSVKIRFTAEKDDAVRVTTYDGLGRVVPAGLGCREAAAGEQVQTVDLTGLPTGVYFVTLKVAGEAYTLRVVKTQRR